MTTQHTIIKNKSGLLELANILGNVSQAFKNGANRTQSCPAGIAQVQPILFKVMGYSRDSFYRFKKLYD